MNFSASGLLNSVTAGVKKAGETSSKMFDRARQYTEENFLEGQKTELDGLQEKIESMHTIKEQTDNLYKQIEKFAHQGSGPTLPVTLPKLDTMVDKLAAVAGPTLPVTLPKLDTMVDKLAAVAGGKEAAPPKETAPPPPAPTPYTPLAEAFFKAANGHGYLTAFGKALSAIGEAERDIGAKFVDFRDKVMTRVANPLHKTLQGDLKECEAQAKELSIARLDLDSAKRKVREAHTADRLATAENELRRHQYSFERIYDSTDAALDRLHALPVEQVILLREFIEQQRDFHASAQRILDNLLDTMPTLDDVEKETVAATGVKPTAAKAQPRATAVSTPPAAPAESPIVPPPAAKEEPKAAPMSHRARALYDYEPTSPGELELVAGEECTIQQRLDADWVIAEQNGKSGKVPIAYLLITGK